MRLNDGELTARHTFTQMRAFEIAMRAGMKTFEHTHLASEEDIRNVCRIEPFLFVHKLQSLDNSRGNPAFVTPIQTEERLLLWQIMAQETFEYAKKHGVTLSVSVWTAMERLTRFDLTPKAISERKRVFHGLANRSADLRKQHATDQHVWRKTTVSRRFAGSGEHLEHTRT